MRLGDLDALKEKIEEVQYTQEFCIEHQIDYSISMQMLGMVIDNTPSVDTTFREVVAYECGQKSVERPKGEWRLVKRSNYIDIVCPCCNNIRFPQYACGFSIEKVKEHLKSVILPDYCESCGAYMGGKEE